MSSVVKKEALKHGYYHSYDEEEVSEADNKRKIELDLLKQLTDMVIEKGDKAHPNRSFRPYREAVAYRGVV